MQVQIAKVNIVSKTNFREVLISDVAAIIIIKEDKISVCVNLRNIEEVLEPKEYFDGSSTFVNVNSTLFEYDNITVIKMPNNGILRCVIYKKVN